MSTQTLFIGASRGCGFYALLKLLQSQPAARATLLLRKPDAVASNPEYLALTPEQRGRVTIVQGDALVKADVQRAVDAAVGLDTVVFSLGVAPGFSITRGFTLDPPQPCARAITALLSVLQAVPRPGLRLVIVSSMGMGEKHKELPFAYKWFYAYALHEPHVDKEVLEYLSLRASKHRTPAPPAQLSTFDFAAESASLRSDWLDEVVVVRPAILLDGKETGTFRAAAVVPSAYTISRKDTGRFIAEQCLKGVDKWVGEDGVVLAY